MRERLEQILAAYDALTERLGDPTVLADQKEYARLAKEHRAQAALAEKAREYVGLLDELLDLPDGIQTILQPHGRPLSHRQACRLMIARAIVGRPRLLILDGALDQIDRRYELEQLTAPLFSRSAPWTLICITERPDLLARCDRVMALRDGAAADTTLHADGSVRADAPLREVAR